ncbi:hypothetical protein ACWF94_04210 [Streptomyces sp. NPDC055078]
MPRESADALAKVVEELYFTTRRPKHEVLAAFVSVVLEHIPEAERRLKGQ